MMTINFDEVFEIGEQVFFKLEDQIKSGKVVKFEIFCEKPPKDDENDLDILGFDINYMVKDDETGDVYRISEDELSQDKEDFMEEDEDEDDEIEIEFDTVEVSTNFKLSDEKLQRNNPLKFAAYELLDLIASSGCIKLSHKDGNWTATLRMTK